MQHARRDPAFRVRVVTAALLALTVLVVVVVVVVADGGSRSNGAGACPAGTEAAVTAAYTNVFARDAMVSPEARAASLVGGDDPAVRRLLDAWLADTANLSTNLSVQGVSCTGPRRAAVDTTLELAGVQLPKVIPKGRALLDGGTWKVATSTFCRRIILSDPESASMGACARYAPSR